MMLLILTYLAGLLTTPILMALLLAWYSRYEARHSLPSKPPILDTTR